MTHRTVREVMTRSVVTASPDTSFRALVASMSEHRISALPVVEADGRLAGVVSEADLLRKEEYQDDRAARRPPRDHDRRARAGGLTAREVMSSPAITIAPEASVVAAARTLDRRHVHHLVVIEADGAVAGILSAHDLLKVYLRTDEEIAAEIRSHVITQYLGLDPDRVDIAVKDGVVTLRGEVEHKSMVPLAIRMARDVDGVVDVAAGLAYAIDDSRLPTAADLGER
ncbi:MAG TPA: CBS domain-containing protein [Streptosporangiaceae bacterium]|nr:CBS domain-containing protein [Streptosporangiaceae bacterium]